MFCRIFRTRPMRVVIVCDPSRVDGGASKVAIASARGLATAGVCVDYVCTSGPPAAELSHPNIEVHCLNMASVWAQENPVAAAAQGIWNGPARKEVETLLGRLPRKDTLVHFHQWTKSFSPSVLAVPARLGMPAVVSLHDYFLACPNGAYYHFTDATPCTLTPMSGACLTKRCDSRSSLHKAVRIARQYTTGKALAQAGASLSVLSVSPFAERVIDAFLPKQHQRFVVRSPIDIDRGDPVRVTGNSQFVFVGRMTEEKGVRQLAKAAHHANLPVTFVGDGPLLEDLRALGPSIRCTGWLDPSGVDAILRQARALVFPSTWYETGGLVVLEALARGIPVLVSRTTAPAEFVVDGQNGFLIDPHNGSDLQARMQELTNDATAERMGRQAHERYWADPQTSAVHVANLLRVYETILSGHRMESPASAA
jgi:glycosyltransferase involved in cell wall biosynthesis